MQPKDIKVWCTNLSHSKDIAILYFARSAHFDLKKGRFGRCSTHRNLVQALDKSTRMAIRQSKLPVLEFDETNQVGTDLASRLASAFKAAFAQGYQGVIAIGNDTPDLQVAHLVQASKALNDKSPVLGPAIDGGNYLIGLRKEDFDEARLRHAIAVGGSSHSRLSDLLSTAICLETLGDIDDLQDLEKWLRASAKNRTLWPLRIKLQSLLEQSRGEALEIIATQRSILGEGIGFRGPPVLT